MSSHAKAKRCAAAPPPWAPLSLRLTICVRPCGLIPRMQPYGCIIRAMHYTVLTVRLCRQSRLEPSSRVVLVVQAHVICVMRYDYANSYSITYCNYCYLI